MRRQVALLAAISAAAPASLLAAALLPVLVAGSSPSSRVPVYVALVLLTAVGVARSVLFRRFSAAEQAVVRFWAFAPTLALLTASVLGALPVLALDALHVHMGRAGLFALAAALAVTAGLVVWALWLRLSGSLAQAASKSAA